MMPREMTPMYV
jgi:hypothetical protein